MFAGCGEPIGVGAPDQDSARAECERLDHVRTATDPSIDEDLGLRPDAASTSGRTRKEGATVSS